ncbi:MAG: hypothetical protein JO172_05860 [Hyphomicrobiales bacterium]|nr:hypothetical protein [Hyphomicrobiales bacterium]
MDAKVLGLCSAAIIVAASATIPSSVSRANTRSEAGVYEAYRRYSQAPANDFWYYHPGGPFYLYAHRHYAYGSRPGVWRGHRRHAGWHGAHWRHQYAWHGQHGWGWAQHRPYGGWGGSLVDGKCWSGEPALWGWRETHVC